MSLDYRTKLSICLDIDKLLFAIYGGLLNGIGYGLVFAHHGSMGGMDIITMFIKLKEKEKLLEYMNH